MTDGKGGKDGNDGKDRKDGTSRNAAQAAKEMPVLSRGTARVRHAFLCFVLLPIGSLLTASVLSAQSLTKRLDARLDRPPFNRQLWGVALADENGRLLYSRNADRLFIPASNTKLVVAAVASALLPPDWAVKTSVYGGPVVGGILLGDLVLYGRGDPTMDRRCYATDSTLAGVCETDPFSRLRELADSLRAKGVQLVQGDLVGDGSYFEPTLVHPNWE